MSGMNAYQFKHQYIDTQAENSFFRIMTRELNYYFFSHTHDVVLELYTKTDIVGHFFDFFNYLTRNYNGIDVSRAYSAYYVSKYTDHYFLNLNSKNSLRKELMSRNMSGRHSTLSQALWKLAQS